jgi:RNA polymerase sigma factor for flagellar operon FliA
MDTTALWDAHLQLGDPAARERLLTEHLGLVHHVARQLSRSLAADTDFDELVSAGSIGLMNAVDTFEPERGLAFSTFAAPRIRGAILDELRRQDHVPRSVRRKSRDLTAAREALTHSLGRAPDPHELASHLGIDLETLWRWQADIEGTVQVSLERSARPTESTATAPETVLAGETGDDIEDRVTLSQETGHLREALLHLKEQERTVLSLYYFEELKLHEIATVLELTESRISQIRSKAISRLRAEMAPLRERVA